jgi:hypothetical protein
MRPKLVLSFCLAAVVYSALPLLTNSVSPDICCADQDDCPSGSRCATDAFPCSGEREGYCVPINTSR